MPPHVVLAVATMVFTAAQAGAWWILGCGSPVVVERIDPIVSPGILSGHLLTVLGGDAFASNLTYEDTQKASCTTCVVTKDLSNYVGRPLCASIAPLGCLFSNQEATLGKLSPPCPRDLGIMHMYMLTLRWRSG